ncbi:MAG TPA: GtrA family protein [Aliidongia sp.]|uniref:GtrA family protein n=1 Tax=Aliidongia sp. TaxID=1914230 RepID=UPI002DDDAD9F|nr:GtrA family protein [Aliidongia sp.]HEV2678221.1 GtrA family protein [Aliidongia sp.]
MNEESARERPWFAQFARFALVGVVGFLVDTGCLLGYLAVLPDHFLDGRAISYLAAATTTWLLNASFTFGRTAEPRLRQWGRFVMFNLTGGAVNYGVYAALVVTQRPIAAHPVIAVALGSLCGLGVNFMVSRHFVFGGEK